MASLRPYPLNQPMVQGKPEPSATPQSEWFRDLRMQANQTAAIATQTGVLMPTLTTAERNALTPVAGQTIFNLTTTKLEIWDGATWQAAW